MKKVFILTLICIYMLTFATGIFTLPVAAETEVAANSGGNNTPIQVSDELGAHLRVTAPICAVSFCMPTWGSNGQYNTDISVYEWKTDYYETISERPLVTKRFYRLDDNAVNRLDFGKELPAGEYLFLIHNPEGTVGCWSFPDSGFSRGNVLLNGQKLNCELWMSVFFSGNAPENPFEKVESNYGNMPKYEELTDSTDFSALGLPDDSLFLTNRVKTESFGMIGKYRSFEKNDGSERNAAVVMSADTLLGYDEKGLYALVLALANARTDVIFTELTSDGQIDGLIQTVLPVFESAHKNGVFAAKLAFLLTSNDNAELMKTQRSIYLKIYRPGKFRSVWFYFDGNPLILSRKARIVYNTDAEKEIRTFFTFRSLSENGGGELTTFGEWKLSSPYPQTPAYASNAQRSLGIAEEICVDMSDLDTQFEYANEIDPALIIFNDGKCDEKITDLKETYLKYAAAVAEYKGTVTEKASDGKNIDISAGVSQWSDVTPYYASYAGGNEAGNDVLGAQVTHYGEDVFFIIECAENITGNLYLYLDTDTKDTGYLGFDKLIEYDGGKNSVGICSFSGENGNTGDKSALEFTADGRYLQIKVKKTQLGVSDDFELRFTAASGNAASGNSAGGNAASGDSATLEQEFDAAPGGVFVYRYLSAKDEPEETGESTSENSVTAEETTEYSDESTGGCGSVIFAPVSVSAVFLTVFAIKKKKII